MTEPLFHPDTSTRLIRLKAALPQSLLLSGPMGVGLRTVAMWLAGDYLIDQLTPRDSKGTASPGGTISVEAIRQLYEQTRARTTTKQIIIIDNADRMSSGAAAAFLKLLEEPTPGTYFILTSHQPQLLLATIRSRVQQTAVKPLTADQATQFLLSLGIDDPIKKAQLVFIAPGLPAELSRLASDEVYFQAQATIMSDARDFLQANTYKKLLIIHRYRQDRDRTIQLIDASLKILHRSLTAKPQPSLVHQIEQLLEVRERIVANGNAMLQLARFVV